MIRPHPEPPPGLPGLLGIRLLHVSPDRVEAVLTVAAEHLAATGYVHAACIVALADTACGYGCLENLPAGKAGFTTLELKTNHLATARVGQQLRVVATPLHLGGTTHVWDAVVTSTTGADARTVAVFRCTQLLLDGRSARQT